MPSPKWQPGQSGNPTGSKPQKRFLDALTRAIVQDNGDRLRRAADELLNAAAGGEPWAIAMLADRLDGKPKQEVDIESGPSLFVIHAPTVASSAEEWEQNSTPPPLKIVR